MTSLNKINLHAYSAFGGHALIDSDRDYVTLSLYRSQNTLGISNRLTPNEALAIAAKLAELARNIQRPVWCDDCPDHEACAQGYCYLNGGPNHPPNKCRWLCQCKEK